MPALLHQSINSINSHCGISTWFCSEVGLFCVFDHRTRIAPSEFEQRLKNQKYTHIHKHYKAFLSLEDPFAIPESQSYRTLYRETPAKALVSSSLCVVWLSRHQFLPRFEAVMGWFRFPCRPLRNQLVVLWRLLRRKDFFCGKSWILRPNGWVMVTPLSLITLLLAVCSTLVAIEWPECRFMRNLCPDRDFSPLDVASRKHLLL